MSLSTEPTNRSRELLPASTSRFPQLATSTALRQGAIHPLTVLVSAAATTQRNGSGSGRLEDTFYTKQSPTNDTNTGGEVEVLS